MQSDKQQPTATGTSSTNSQTAAATQPTTEDRFDEAMTKALERREGLRRLGHLQALESLGRTMATEDEFVRRDMAIGEAASWGKTIELDDPMMPTQEGDEEMRLTSAGDITINFGERKPDEKKPEEPLEIRDDPQAADVDYERIARMIASGRPEPQSLMRRALPWVLAALGGGSAFGLWMNSGSGTDTDTQFELRFGDEKNGSSSDGVKFRVPQLPPI